MPLRLKDIERYGAPISFQSEGTAMVRVNPISATAWLFPKIPLDGRQYICAGSVFLRNGSQWRANFEINTLIVPCLEWDTVKIFIEAEQAWYYMHEPELFSFFGVKREEALPYQWLPDIPLDHRDKGPYPMNWPGQ